jgi:hypothetical protein
VRSRAKRADGAYQRTGNAGGDEHLQQRSL